MHLRKFCEVGGVKHETKICFSTHVGVGANAGMGRVAVRRTERLDAFERGGGFARRHIAPANAINAVEEMHHMDALIQ